MGSMKVKSVNGKEPAKNGMSQKRKVEDIQVDQQEEGFESDEGDFEDYSDNDEVEPSELERVREENIKKNKEIFDQFGISKAKSEVAVKKKKSNNGGISVGGLHVKHEKKVREVLPPRKSLRLQNVAASGGSLVPTRYEVEVTRVDPRDVRKPVEMALECMNDLEE